MTAFVFDGILYLVVVLRKLAMPAAGGVPCVGSTFFLPQHRKKEYEENEFLKFPSIIGYIATGEETLWDIAKKYHTTVDSIKNGNHVLADRASERVKRGDKLLLVKAAR